MLAHSIYPLELLKPKKHHEPGFWSLLALGWKSMKESVPETFLLNDQSWSPFPSADHEFQWVRKWRSSEDANIHPMYLRFFLDPGTLNQKISPCEKIILTLRGSLSPKLKHVHEFWSILKRSQPGSQPHVSINRLCSGRIQMEHNSNWDDHWNCKTPAPSSHIIHVYVRIFIPKI